MEKHEEVVISNELRWIKRDGERVLQQRHKITRYYNTAPEGERPAIVVEDGWEWRDVPCAMKESA
jgi:hypothetical protein